MYISIISIDKSKVMRLSKSLIKKYNINDKIELILTKDFLIFKPIKKVRIGWGKSFKKMHENGDDKLL